MADSVTTKTYKELTQAQEQMGEDNIAGAITTLTALLDSVKDESLDKALTLQMLGYASMADERFGDAIIHLKQSLALNKLPEQVKFNVGYMVAQLHAAQGEFEQALTFAAEWFETLESPSPSQMMFMANIYAQTKQYKKAIPYAKQAILSSDKPRESWFQLLTASYFELKDFGSAARTLKQIVNIWPENPSYWEQLASVYVMLEDEARALATLKLAWTAGTLSRETSIKSMVQLAVARGIPEHAARLLESGFEQDLLPRDESYVRLLANAWVAARENDAAILAFNELARIESSGDPLLRAANLHIEQGKWDHAERMLQAAIDAGLKQPGKAWLLLGIARAEQENFKDSLAALRKARTFDDTKRSASRWLSYAQDMRKQYEWQLSYGE
ncbi:MAG: tetratricopeptide repeat protein [Pseudomonadota bacterium]|nr:tetratricopeptide repeat protein [Pseudomonadota bacterium]